MGEQFNPVGLETLHEGMLTERSLYIHLPSSDRYVRMVAPLRPLEARILEKFKRAGNVFASGTELKEKYPRLEESALNVSAAVLNDELAPFEKNLKVREATDWLVPLVLGATREREAPLFLFHRAFGIPRPETLLHVMDISVDGYERGIVLAAVSGVLALWLGYSDPGFLRQYVESVFCSELAGQAAAPGTEKADHRFKHIGGGRRAPGDYDELEEIARFASALFAPEGVATLPFESRVARKLERQFNLEPGFASTAGKAVA